jgi:hypothetical protein
MADVTINELTKGTPTGSNILPYSTGSNTLGVPVSALLQNAGNVGIGTASPRAKLDVNGYVFLAGGQQIQITGSEGTTGLQLVGEDAAASLIGTMSLQALVIRTNAIERMRIAATGNVGIGTTTPAAKLDVNGSIYGNLAGNTGCPIQHYGVMRNAIFANNIVENNFTVYKKSVCIFTWNATAYRATSTGLMAATLKLQGPSYSTMTDIASVEWFTNEAASHKTSPTNQTSVTLLPGEYIVRVTTNVNTDSNDRANCGIIAIASE